VENVGEKSLQFVLGCTLLALGVICLVRPEYLKMEVIEIGNISNYLHPIIGVVFLFCSSLVYPWSRTLKRIG